MDVWCVLEPPDIFDWSLFRGITCLMSPIWKCTNWLAGPLLILSVPVFLLECHSHFNNMAPLMKSGWIPDIPTAEQMSNPLTEDIHDLNGFVQRSMH